MYQAYELFIIWDDGTKETYVYPSERLAYEALYNLRMLMGFGPQISWAQVIKHREVFDL